MIRTYFGVLFALITFAVLLAGGAFALYHLCGDVALQQLEAVRDWAFKPLD